MVAELGQDWKLLIGLDSGGQRCTLVDSDRRLLVIVVLYLKIRGGGQRLTACNPADPDLHSLEGHSSELDCLLLLSPSEA